jgi:hypothetical protein
VVHAKRRAKSTNAGSDLVPLMLLEKTDNCGLQPPANQERHENFYQSQPIRYHHHLSAALAGPIGLFHFRRKTTKEKAKKGFEKQVAQAS